MRKLFSILALLCVLFLTVACGSEEEFVIRCDIKGLGTRGLEMVYVTRSGISRLSFHPVDGKVDIGTVIILSKFEISVDVGQNVFAHVVNAAN